MGAGPVVPRQQLWSRVDPFPKIAHPLSGEASLCLPQPVFPLAPGCKARRLTLVLGSEAWEHLPPPPTRARLCAGAECSRCHGTAPVPNEPALGVALCRGFRPHCPRWALRRLDFPAASHLSSLVGQWEAPALAFLCFPHFLECAHTTFIRDRKLRGEFPPLSTPSVLAGEEGCVPPLQPSRGTSPPTLSPTLVPFGSPGCFLHKQARVS